MRFRELIPVANRSTVILTPFRRGVALRSLSSCDRF
jgi:hypothetical protein